MLGYANSIRTVDGGTHIDGIKASLTRTLNNLGKKLKIIKVCILSFSFLFFLRCKVRNLVLCRTYGKLSTLFSRMIPVVYIRDK